MKELLPEENMRISTDAVNYLIRYFEDEIERVIEEAVKSNYTVIKEIDIRRGINKERKLVLKQIFDALDWSITEFYRLKHRLEKDLKG